MIFGAWPQTNSSTWAERRSRHVGRSDWQCGLDRGRQRRSAEHVFFRTLLWRLPHHPTGRVELRLQAGCRNSPGSCIGGEGGIDSNRLKAILTPAGRTACVQNAFAFCRTSAFQSTSHSQKQIGARWAPIIFWRRGWDSNPRYGKTAHLISNQALSTTQTPLQYSILSSPVRVG